MHKEFSFTIHQAAVEKQQSQKQAVIDILEKKLGVVKDRMEELEGEKLKALPPDAALEVKKAKDKLVNISIKKGSTL